MRLLSQCFVVKVAKNIKSQGWTLIISDSPVRQRKTQLRAYCGELVLAGSQLEKKEVCACPDRGMVGWERSGIGTAYCKQSLVFHT